ncbi:hypothetical protein AVEN_50403-1 [Araneus ventricosus]|uniref:Uncharacterized protein n=1 Tax=Araneus ventricosus TaxID=182803 RepID=A0A4Y2RJE5_ARAVE|nr:hypothetical protein AVEN_50403-1 [Araneus ventricosus]
MPSSNYRLTKDSPELKHVAYLETNMCTPMLKRSSVGERSQSVAAFCLTVVDTGEMVLRHELSEAGKDDSRWEQDREFWRDGQTPPRGTDAAVV